jgi:chromosome segregation ATPase
MNTFTDLSPRNSADSPGHESQKSFENIDASSCDISENLLRHFEKEIFRLQNEVRQKNNEIQSLSELILSKASYFNGEAEAEMKQSYQKTVDEANTKIKSLEYEVKAEKKLKEQYLQALGQSENKIEQLEDENQRLNDEMRALITENMKLKSVFQDQDLDFLNQSEYSNLCFTNEKEVGPGKFVHITFADHGEDYLSTHESDMPHPLKLNKKMSKNDSTLHAKVDLLQEKLVYEERKGKELEYVISSQKTVMDSSKETISKLKKENKDLEDQMEELNNKLEELKEIRMKEKTKLDNITSFYELLQNVQQQQNDAPRKTSHDDKNSSQIRLNLGKIDEAPENNTITKDIDHLKQELGSLCKVVQNSMNSEKPKDHTAMFLNPQLSYLMSTNQQASSPKNTGFKLAKAVQNSGSLWTNLNFGSMNDAKK